MKKQQGMTLIEVLIAGIILFIAIAALTFVARVQVEHQERFTKTIRQAYLAEFFIDDIRYRLNFTDQRSGVINYRGVEYDWTATLKKEDDVVVTVLPEESMEQGRGIAKLFEVQIKRNEAGRQLMVFSFTELTWKPGR